MISISKEDLSEEEFEAVITSSGFQKMLLYQRLADGIDVLRTHDRLYKSMIRAITEQHSEIDSVDSIEEVLSLFEHEVATYTEPLTANNDNEPELLTEPVSTFDDVPASGDATVKDDPEKIVREYLEDRFEECDEIKIKANEIASDIELRSTHVGGILGRWRNAENPPFAITASESATSGNVWTIKQTV
ncbi:hypothetical protein [Salinibaculum salinum]|uniref:hypothetical protein n=1 Tax=Salinibaculum salinum TaxID=3131996 RepID=UPI0030EDE349